MEHFWRDNTIFGPDEWFSAADFYAQMVAHASEGSRFVELGTDLGRSTACMGVEIIRSGKKLEFTTVDIFLDPEREAWCRKNLAALVAGGYARIIKGESAAVAAAFADRSLDFVFIDAAHDTASVMRDIGAWLPKMKSGGTLAGDDFWWPDGAPEMANPPPGTFPVREAVTRCLGSNYELMIRNGWAIWYHTVP